MKTLTKLGKKQQGQDKSQAKGAKRKDVVTINIGNGIVDAMENQTVKQKLLALIEYNLPTQEQALREIEARRTDAIKDTKARLTGKDRARAENVVHATFSRIIKIVKAIIAKHNVDKIAAAHTFDEMSILATRGKSADRNTTKKPMDENRFDKWSRQLRRIVGEQPGKTAKPAERVTFDQQISRLEQHLRQTLAALAKYEHVTMIPVKQILTLTNKAKGKLRRVA